MLGISRQKLIDAIRLYSDRNQASHNPPPTIEENIKDDGKIDWISVRKKCEEKKTSLEADVLADRITEEQRDQFHVLIDEWLRLHLRGTVKKRNSDKTRRQPSPFPSFYRAEKWDDIDF